MKDDEEFTLRCSDLVDTVHSARIIVATKGAIVVSVQIQETVFKGVLLDITNSSLAPAVVTLPKSVGAKEDPEDSAKSTVAIDPTDCEPIPATQFRHTYQSDLDDRYYPTIIPSKSITSSIHRLDERPNLRIRNPKGKLFLCSMCKTHCFDTDNSDREGSATNLTTPPIKISFNAPSGPSIMEIEPKAYKKAHKRKHKNKKQKKSKRDSIESALPPKLSVNGYMEHKDDRLEAGPETGSTSNMDPSDSDANGLIMNIPTEQPLPARRRKRKVSNPQSLYPKKPPPEPEAPPPTKTRTKTKAAILRDRKPPATGKQNKTGTQGKAGAKKPKKEPHVAESIVSELVSKCVSTYESSGGKHISVGDVIWGKIIGFPWWPGRVCAITVNENKDGVIMDYIADIDWYCSPTKSNLPCASIHPFLEDYEKRFDKKKKTKSYLKAINEAKCDAVMNAQFMEAALRDEEHTAPLLDPEQPASPDADQADPAAADHVKTIPLENPHEDNPANTALEKGTGPGGDSALLIDAFLRTQHTEPGKAGPPPQAAKPKVNAAEDFDPDADYEDSDDGDENMLTIAIPSPESLLK